jgi:hypothetical protein
VIVTAAGWVWYLTRVKVAGARCVITRAAFPTRRLSGDGFGVVDNGSDRTAADGAGDRGGGIIRRPPARQDGA